MNALYELDEGGASEVARRLNDEDSYDSIRVTLGILEKKGHLMHRTEGRRNVYRPTVPRERATKTALRSVTRTFFGGSPSKAILTMLDMSSHRLTREDLDEIAAWIDNEKKS
jgi:predicted transcriptional regulator